MTGSDPDEVEAVREALRPEFPHWHVWRGVTGVLYARRPRSSKVVRAADAGKLAEKMRRKEKRP